ncbi:MAG TPA: efflux RND transporter periplasmic adaptor subunit [Chloroflexota bacterium]|nr:efflux RND transporter periplasmic adaptor subunit [Chloroflexota bacterium]
MLSRKRIILYACISLVPLIAALWIAGFDPNYVLGNYVTTSDAYVTGNLSQASAPASGEVTQLLTSIGDPVHPGQVLAYLAVPPQSNRELPLVPQVRSPAPGTVVHLFVLVGQMVSAGQPVATIADLRQLWVVASVDESSFAYVHLGQRADVTVTALNQTFPGRVSQLMPDLQSEGARTGVPSTGANVASGAPRASNGIPVRIDFDYGDALVYPGMSATVSIYIR